MNGWSDLRRGNVHGYWRVLAKGADWGCGRSRMREDAGAAPETLLHEPLLPSV